MITTKPVMMDLLKLLFQFSQSANLLESLKGFLSSYIKVQGKSIMQSIDPDKGSSILFTVKKLIDFKLLTDSIVSEAFSNNEDLKNA